MIMPEGGALPIIYGDCGASPEKLMLHVTQLDVHVCPWFPVIPPLVPPPTKSQRPIKSC
jgi:hypothetical protein